MEDWNNVSYSSVDPSALVTHDRERIAVQIKTILSLYSPHLSSAVVADIGSSSGAVSRRLLRFVHHISCFDCDRDALAIGRAQNKNHGLTFTYFDGIHMPVKAKRFDIIILRRTFEYVLHPKQLINEIYRVLKPGGLVYLEYQNRFPFTPLWKHTHLFQRFSIHRMTPRILKHPRQFNFTKRYGLSRISKIIPLALLERIKPLLPVVIWVLQKPIEDPRRA